MSEQAIVRDSTHGWWAGGFSVIAVGLLVATWTNGTTATTAAVGLAVAAVWFAAAAALHRSLDAHRPATAPAHVRTLGDQPRFVSEAASWLRSARRGQPVPSRVTAMAHQIALERIAAAGIDPSDPTRLAEVAATMSPQLAALIVPPGGIPPALTADTLEVLLHELERR